MSKATTWWGTLGLALVAMAALPVVAVAGTCGGAVTCACGDDVNASRTLTSADPITKPPACTGVGLTIITGGITLSLNGRAIVGSGTATGIAIAPGVNGVTVTTGRVFKFGTGIGATDTTDSTIADLTLRQHTVAAIDVTGGGNTVTGNIAQAGHKGVVVTGDDSVVTKNRAVGNTADGITVTGALTTVTRNVCESNTGTGLVVAGAGAFVERNQCTANGGDGLSITGNGHVVNRNTARRNTGDGLSVAGGAGGTLDRNVTDRNGGVGIRDETSDGGTAGTANTYTRNVCDNDLLGDSAPAGLCL